MLTAAPSSPIVDAEQQADGQRDEDGDQRHRVVAKVDPIGGKLSDAGRPCSRSPSQITLSFSQIRSTRSLSDGEVKTATISANSPAASTA